jgi:NCS1 family nucleobase:cation symporter-1
MAKEHAEGDRPWHIEVHGIDAIPADERHGTAKELFWIWFAANISILGVVYGAIVMSFGLSFLQGVLVAVLGLLSFLLVGYFGVPGARSGAPTLTLSRATFGMIGNVVPTFVSWLNLLGWETFLLVTSVYSVEGFLEIAFHLPATTTLTVISLAVVAVVSFGLGVLGHSTIALIQTVFTWAFGLLTLAVIAYLVPHMRLGPLLHAPNGPWLTGFLPALSVIVAGSGLSWANTAADYTRYLPTTTSSRAIVFWSTFGSFLPLFVLMLVGMFLYEGIPGLASAANPIALIGSALPTWMAVPYLILAVGGLVAGLVLDVYSSGLNLLAMYVRVPRYRSIYIDAVVTLAASLYILFVSKNFFGDFYAFLLIVAGLLAPWAAVYLVDAARRLAGPGYDAPALQDRDGPYRGARPGALVAWAAGALTVILFASSPPVWSGPLAVGVFKGSSLNLLLGFAVSLVLALLVAERPRRA